MIISFLNEMKKFRAASFLGKCQNEKFIMENYILTYTFHSALFSGNFSLALTPKMITICLIMLLSWEVIHSLTSKKLEKFLLTRKSTCNFLFNNISQFVCTYMVTNWQALVYWHSLRGSYNGGVSFYGGIGIWQETCA